VTSAPGPASGAGIDPLAARRARRVQTADVYKAGRLAATLTRTAHGVQFAYLASHLEAGGPPVASTLPLTENPSLSPAGAVPAFFAGLLPEGRRLSSLRRAVKTSADDELSLLLAVGTDPVGDVQVLPHGEHPLTGPPMISVQKSFAEVDFTSVLRDERNVDPVALAGVQDKASAGMISVPVARQGKRFILKIDPPEYPGVVLNEAFFIRRAAQAGLPVVHADVVHDAAGNPGLLVERFDRLAAPDGSTQSLAVEDGAQVMARYPADKYAVTAEEVVLALSALCPARMVAARALFGQLCFAWLTGNGDVHAKNLAVLATPDGEWRISPAYDLPSTLLYGDLDLALPIQGQTQGLSRRSLMAFAAAIGLPERSARQTLDGLLDATSELGQDLANAGLPFSANALHTMQRRLRNRWRAAGSGTTS
jgi:serine/threonine-protein kinase HipA